MIKQELEAELANLLKSKSLTGKNGREALDYLGRLIDVSWTLHEPSSIKLAQSLAENLKLNGFEEVELFYLLGNSWAALRECAHPESRSDLSWEIEEMEKELIYLRRAAYHPYFKQLSLVRRCQILTNLAGRLSEIGRPVDAINYWDRAIKEFRNFGMAYGNKGIGLWKYSHHLYNDNYRALFLIVAEKCLKISVRSKNTEPDARVYFQNELKRIPKIKVEGRMKPNENFGKSKEEIRYRKWCLFHKLFLNPLNDLENNSYSIRDMLALPSITTAAPEMPMYFNRFNLLKQEYITARHLLFLSQDSNKLHYADKSVTLVNTLDYQLYSMRIEYNKLAFRSAYSILDKIAFFLNDYFELSLHERKVYFRSVWYKDGNKKNGLVDIFSSSKNWPLRGLFWLSKDIFEDAPDYRDAISPDAKQLNELRNHLEHKFVTLHDFFREEKDKISSDGIMPLKASDFHTKTHHVLSLCREALIYLSMAIHVEEQRKLDYSTLSMPIPLTNIEDEWKTLGPR